MNNYFSTMDSRWLHRPIHYDQWSMVNLIPHNWLANMGLLYCNQTLENLEYLQSSIYNRYFFD